MEDAKTMETSDACPTEDAKTMETSDACPTEDAVQALLEYFVDPLLPTKPSTSDVPSKADQELVAKQVHAVVVLYNYYHRRKHPHLKYLGLEAFCKLATVFRPILLLYLKESRETEHCDASERPSLMQQVITNACGLCASLDVLSDPQSIEKWPIREVAVFLVDSERKMCYLQHSLITQGSWSLIVKPVHDSHRIFGCELGESQTDESITTKDQHLGEGKDFEIVFEKIAFSAVEEATGVKQNAVMILERHVVYSLSKEKTAVRFYIMRCFSGNSDLGTVPIEDAVNSLQGPLLQNDSSIWTTTPVVEYFHVLPFSDVVADWFSRGEDYGFLEKKAATSLSVDVDENGRTEDTEDTEEIVNERVKAQEAPKVHRKTVTSNCGRSRKRVSSKTMGDGQSCDDLQPNKDLLRNSAITVQKESHSNGKKNGFELGSGSKGIQHSADHRGSEIQKRKIIADEPQIIADSVAVDTHNSNLDLKKFQALVLSKAKLLSETALRVLLCKRDKLTLQQRNIEDEIAKCDDNIQKILRGGEDDWELKLESIIECCNDVYPRRIAIDDNSACQSYKRLKLSQHLPCPGSSCQKLDNICYENNWILPTYRISSSNRGFKAEVRLKERQSEYSTCGEEKPNPKEARDSAAACLLAKLHSNTQSS